VVFWKPEYMFQNAAPDNDQELLAGEDQGIFNLEGEKYYLPPSKRHFLLSYFQSITVPQKMKWAVTQFIDSVHIGILMLNG